MPTIIVNQLLTIKRYLPGDVMKIANYTSINRSVKRWAIVIYKEDKVIVIGDKPAVYDRLWIAQRALADINRKAVTHA
jgi:hypothetical protein